MKETSISWDGLPTFFQRASERKKSHLRLRDYLALPAAVPWIAGLRKVEFVGTESEVLQLTQVLFGRKRVLGRLLHTAYPLPESLEGFFSGSSQANLRKSSNAAKRDGYSASWLRGAELLTAVNTILVDRLSDKGQLDSEGLYRNTRVAVNESEGVVVFSPGGTPVSVIVGMRLNGVFLHRLAIGSEHGRARWLAFATLVTEGHSRGVRLIIGERVWAMGRGDILFQERLRFMPVNLRIIVEQVSSLQFQILN